MASPLVETKLFIPRPREGAVSRPRLGTRLRQGAEAKLTLVSAPAGFGKTTALAAWLAEPAPQGRSVAWLSLEEDDCVTTTFWTYVVTAVARSLPGVGADVLALLAAPQPQVRTVLATLLNELSTVPTEVCLVLDDYHLVDGPNIGADMTFVLEHLPPNVHLVISTRADPALPLPRLRARGDLVEVRADDLRFTADEVADYLDRALGSSLDAHDMGVLEARTEGWIAALQLAALSLQGRTDIGGFIAGFAGDDRYVVDYLVDEVLDRQPADVRRFLVDTCILDRLSGSLCDAVTGQRGGRAMLEALDRANLFIVPLDKRRRWYRYHHLFADVLQAHLADDRPEDIPVLHRRASQWFEEAGETQAAVRHAALAGDMAYAAALVELAIPDFRRTRQDGTIRGWVDLIPDDVVKNRPVLAVLFVGALMTAGEFDGVEERLDDIQRWLDTGIATEGKQSLSPPDALVVVDRDQLAALPATVELYRAALALSRDDAPGTIEHARLAMERAPEDDDLTRAGASALVGLASWRSGDLDAAHRAYSVSVDGMRRVGHVADILGCSITLADICLTQGRLRDAAATYEEALLLARATTTGSVLPGTADMHVGLAQIACERDDMDAAMAHLLRSQELGERAGLPQNPYRWRVAMAQVRDAHGDTPAALALLDEAQALYTGDFSPDVRPVAATRARLLASHGHVGRALAWAAERGLSAGDDLSYLQEYEHVTLARVLLARYRADGDGEALREATVLLERLLAAAESGGRTGTAIEVLALLALARHAGGDNAGGVVHLERALSLAEPEGHIRVFVREGLPMADLLGAAAPGVGESAYVRRLLAACRDTNKHRARAEPAAPGGDHPGPVPVEPLSARELVVLRQLSTDLDGPGIARHLFVSLHTVRTHTKHIYAKLGVNSRRAAVRRAEELGLLTAPPR